MPYVELFLYLCRQIANGKRTNGKLQHSCSAAHRLPGQWQDNTSEPNPFEPSRHTLRRDCRELREQGKPVRHRQERPRRHRGRLVERRHRAELCEPRCGEPCGHGGHRRADGRNRRLERRQFGCSSEWLHLLHAQDGLGAATL